MSEERLELVTDFASLRAGDLVVYRDCSWCGGAHRTMCVKLEVEGLLQYSDGSTVVNVRHWDVAPAPAHARNGRFGLSADAVARRCVYRVIIPPAAEECEAAIRKEMERARGDVR